MVVVAVQQTLHPKISKCHVASWSSHVEEGHLLLLSGRSGEHEGLGGGAGLSGGGQHAPRYWPDGQVVPQEALDMQVLPDLKC